MTARLPLTKFQASLPNLPRHMLRRISEGPGNCWILRGSAKHHPYGYQSVSINNSSVLAHRFAYETLVGPIPEGLQIDHLCKVTSCVNPEHMEAVTGEVNVARSNCTSAVNSRKTHCKYGHELSGSNLYIRPDNGKRQCKACANQRSSAHKRKRSSQT